MVDRCTDLNSRRTFLAQSTAVVGGAALELVLANRCSAQPSAPRDHYANLRSDDYLGPVEVVAEIDDKKVFLEGPAVDKRGRVYFTNTEAAKILLWDPDAKRLNTYRENSNQANGLFFDLQGRLFACEGGAKRVTRTDMSTGEIVVLADSFRGFPLAAPNDLFVDAKGRVYFTSRPGVDDPTKGNVNAVYRLTPTENDKYEIEQLLAWPTVHMPNGLLMTRDQRTLYVIESHPETDRHRDIRAYDVDQDGRLSNGRVLIDFYPGRSGDGMCIDENDYLYVAAGLHKTRGTSETLDTRPGIHVISPEGRVVAFRETPEDTITNCSFGGPDLKTLYVTCGRKLLSIRTKQPGSPVYRPKN